MPIILDDMTKNASVKLYSPKFFEKNKLTGKGKRVGLLNETRNPKNINPSQNTLHENIVLKKRKYVNGDTTVTMMPINILTQDGWDLMNDYTMPLTSNMTKIGTYTNKTNCDVYLDMEPHSLILEEVASKGNGVGAKKTLTVTYHVFLYFVRDAKTLDCGQEHYLSGATQTGLTFDNAYFTEITCNPLVSLANNSKTLESQGFTMDEKAIEEYIQNYDLYTAMVRRSEQWQETIDILLDKFFKNVSNNYYQNEYLNMVAETLRRIEDYNVPLDLYRNIYKSIAVNFKKDDATELCKQNLNLLLSDTLNNLEKNKPVLSKVTQPAQPINMQTNVPKYSREQIEAISTDEPLVLVQAGAGTGKSTVILGRINYMVATGIDPKDIAVLSFTNAAADNITAKNPDVNSMTIARMIHTIYSKNFPQHELSSLETIMNSLEIYFPNDDDALTFRSRLRDIAKNERDGFTRMNNFVEKHYDDVIKMLDTIRQTSLELEIIICYQKIDTLIEPPEIASKYLIIDEVQDNSIFEFIYTLKYVDKHRESLFIVGDCSQTLYEFRASNPKALNVLEGSGVFETYQLRVNYRSNQEILDFANIALKDIEANQYAHIQLQANSLSQVSEKSFTNKVRFKYDRLNKISEFSDALTSAMAIDIVPYVNERLAIGQQVCFLAFTRNHIRQIQAILEKSYPDKKIVSLVPNRSKPSTIFSDFIRRFWNQMQFAPTKSIVSIITRGIIDNLSYLVYDKDKALQATQLIISDWTKEQKALIDGWQQQFVNGRMSQKDFLENVKQSMLQFEIRRNAIKQALLSAKNEERKKNELVEDADILLSTIHSAKGLEFDNVVVLYRNEARMEEDKKRMYYVALTRAKKTEFIYAYDTAASPKIESDYEIIIEILQEKEKKLAGNKGTLPTGTD